MKLNQKISVFMYAKVDQLSSDCYPETDLKIMKITHKKTVSPIYAKY